MKLTISYQVVVLVYNFVQLFFHVLVFGNNNHQLEDFLFILVRFDSEFPILVANISTLIEIFK